ncbi:ribonuclease E/G, partial [Mycobacterium sp. PS03-16]|uniref:translation initiation factor IF-2 N-terminal domain-containing protein n=1 Tax=Mycobacterium sp. PS03-16 TaxID=2559611 RepID=UPI001101CC83
MADSDDTQAHTSEDSQARERFPERLRVHSLARVLGTTSRRVLDALAEFDGRARSAHSTVDKSEAERVRDALAARDGDAETAAAPDPAPAVTAPAEPQPEPEPEPVVFAEPADDEAPGEEEPESRTLLETELQTTVVQTTVVERADYLPLFVAPQPVTFPRDEDTDDEEDDEDEDDDTGVASDDDQAERPAARRRRRGRRGR